MEADNIVGKPRFKDKTLECRDCRKLFVWEAGEQEFFAKKNLVPPTRCRECRRIRKAQRAQSVIM